MHEEKYDGRVVDRVVSQQDASDLIDLGRVSEETKGSIIGGYDGGVGLQPHS